MAPPLQDQFIDDDEEEEVCPLCVEELDLTDKNFRPCPCGYQICQFCYNNIKTTMNGLCPACRRPYDDKNIQYKVVSPEEMAQHKQVLAQQAKKKAAARQKEAQKREADHLSRKHLAGLRVRQKNLVYVTGLKPKITGDKLVETLRGKEFFGQYGDIVKIVVSKSKDAHQQNQPVGIYITFVRKEDAETCIATVDGLKQNDGSRLRAQHGTTKYCSAFLRGETCSNRNCMFLHEAGEDSESFTRQDLSNLNAISTQQPANIPPSHSPQPQPPPQHTHPVAAAAPDTEHAVHSPVENDGPALPPTASWADQARRASRTTNTSTNSPLVTNSEPHTAEKQEPKTVAKDVSEVQPIESAEPPESSRAAEEQPRKPKYPYFDDLLKLAFNPTLAFNFTFPEHFTDKDRWIVENMPPLFDPNEGTRRRLIREGEAEELLKKQAEIQAELKAASSSEADDAPEQAGGSSQLGGEPEERVDRGFSQHNLLQQQAIGSNPLALSQTPGLGDESSSLGASRGLGQQHTQLQLLQQQLHTLKTFPGNSAQTSNHGRHPSRFFLNEAMGTASKNYAKQTNALYGSNASHSQTSSNQFAFSSVQGPPPGLKTTGTPPVTGGGMFAQGHGFTPGVGYARESEKMWDFHRGRSNASGPDAGKRELMFPPYHQYPSTSTATPAQGVLSYPYGSQQGASYQDSGNPQKQKKKGKKHRHANTSSSGGGVVDVTDPSILQMRVGGSMAGQGGYVPQGQGGFPSSLHSNAYPRW